MIDDRFDPPEKFATSMDRLHETVAKEVGSSNFGEEDYRLGLSVLLQSMDYDPVFSEGGRRIAWGLVVVALCARVRAMDGMAKLPGLERQTVNKPVVITGIPRTGTTALHRLMAVDPQFQGLQTWILNAPMPRPPRETWEDHPLFQQAAKIIDARFEAVKDARAAHNMAAEEVEECLWILRQSFVSNIWTCGWSAPSYDAWWQTQSEAPAYGHLRRVIQLIGAGEPEKRWLLKNPGHIANLDLLFEIFPDAKVVQTHRNPAKAVPSLCKVLINSHDIMEVGRKDLRARILGHRETGKWAKAVRDAEPVRAAHCNQVLDIIHGEFHRDPMGVVERIYAFLDLELSPDVAAAMRRRIGESPERSHGVHRYDAADFGLTEDDIREQFGDYVDRFDLAPQRPGARGESLS